MQLFNWIGEHPFLTSFLALCGLVALFVIEFTAEFAAEFAHKLLYDYHKKRMKK